VAAVAAHALEQEQARVVQVVAAMLVSQAQRTRAVAVAAEKVEQTVVAAVQASSSCEAPRLPHQRQEAQR
jgi:hypothetical protein